MSSIIKKIVFVIAFVLLTLVLPCVLLLMFVDSSENFSTYVLTYGIIIFAVLGYIVASVRGMEKKLEETMDEIKMQNAAIAYKLTNTDYENSVSAPQQQGEISAKEETVVGSTNIPLNPAEPLVMPTVKKTEKPADDGFDDFK